MEVFNPNSNINFLGWRKVSLAISLALIIISLGAIFTRGLNYALDFTGGVLVEAEYKDPVETADVRAALEAAGLGDAVDRPGWVSPAGRGDRSHREVHAVSRRADVRS